MAKKELIGKLSSEEIDALKVKHGEIFQIAVGGHVIYLRKPQRQDISIAHRVSGMIGSLEYFESLMENCYVGGSKEVIMNDSLFLTAYMEFDKVVEVYVSELKKL